MAVIVTIARQYGSGGRSIGQQVAGILKANYVDKELISLAAKRAGVAEEAVARRDERPVTRRDRIIGMIQAYLESSATIATAEAFGGYVRDDAATDILLSLPSRGSIEELDHKRYLELISGVMKDLAQSGSIVIIGRGGNVILKDLPNVLRVLVVAPFDVRIRQVMEREGLSADASAKLVSQMDAERRAFVKQFFKLDWSDPINYDIVLNTGKYSSEFAARLIADAARELEKRQAGV